MAKDRRILLRPQTCETELACVIGERCGNVDSRAPVSTGAGEEHRRNLTDHGPSLPQVAGGALLRGLPELISSGGVARAGSIFRCNLDSSAKSYSYPGA